MMLGPLTLWIGTPLKLFLWVINRLATWTGLLYLWRRLRSRRRFWTWFIIINVASLGSLGLLVCWLDRLTGR